MFRIIWDEKYSVNIRVIDEQHKRLIEILGSIYEKMGRKGEEEILGANIWRLARYAVEHFDTEELFMSEYYFPGYEQHQKEHEVFKTQVAVFQRDFELHKASLPMDIVYFLMGWLDNHILNVDKEYSRFLNEKGVH